MTNADTLIQSSASRTKPSVPTVLKAGYGVGQLGGQIFRDMPAVLLPLFLTTMLGVPAWMAGLAILAPKMWVIFCDPLVGAWSDRRKAEWGRTPFLLVGGLASALSLLLLFIPPVFPAPWMAAAYTTLMFTVASTAFSLFSVPYLTIASEMSEDYHERSSIMAWRLVFTAVGLIIAAGFAQPMVGWLGGGRDGYAGMAAALSAICLVSFLIAWASTKRTKLVDSPTESLPLFTQFRLAARNKPFVIIAASTLIQQLAAAAGYTVLGLFFIYLVGKVEMIIPFIMIMGITAMLVQAPWVWVSRRIGKLQTYMLCVVAWIAVTLSWFLVKPSTDIAVTLPLLGALSTENIWLLVRAFLIGVFNSGFVLMSYSMLTDTMEYDRRRFGVAREGVFAGVFSATEKLAFALGPFVGGIVLSLTGFQPSTGGAGAQDAQALHGILIVYAAIPAALFTLSLLVLRLYKLDEKVIAEAGSNPH